MRDNYEVVAIEWIVDHWKRNRQESVRFVADRRFRSWLFEAFPAQFGLAPNDHCFVIFEVANFLHMHGEDSDAFVLLRWLGQHYVCHPDADLAARAIMALTDTYAQIHYAQIHADRNKNNTMAIRMLHHVLNSIRGHPDILVERALCRARVVQVLMFTYYLQCKPISLPFQRKIGYLLLLARWAKIARCWRANSDPVIRGRVAQAIYNKATLRLLSDREKVTRRELVELVTCFSARRVGVGAEPEVDVWIICARHTLALLDQLTFPAPELKTEYLERQRRSDLDRRPTFLGAPWPLVFPPYNHMNKLIRLAVKRHQVSAAMVRRWACGSTPFVLLLRNFELTERSSASSTSWARETFVHNDGTGDHVRMINLSHTAVILNELVTNVPLVQVANTAAAELELGSSFPQQIVAPTLYLPDATWFKEVAKLIALAEHVVVWANELTPPLNQELTALRVRERTADTTVILEEKPWDPFMDLFIERSPVAHNHELLTAGHPALAEFPHVISAKQLAGKQVRECPELMGLVERLNAARNMSAEQRIEQVRKRLIDIIE